MNNHESKSFRFGTMMLTIIMVCSLFATMTLLGCTKDSTPVSCPKCNQPDDHFVPACGHYSCQGGLHGICPGCKGRQCSGEHSPCELCKGYLCDGETHGAGECVQETEEKKPDDTKQQDDTKEQDENKDENKDTDKKTNGTPVTNGGSDDSGDDVWYPTNSGGATVNTCQYCTEAIPVGEEDLHRLCTLCQNPYCVEIAGVEHAVNDCGHAFCNYHNGQIVNEYYSDGHVVCSECGMCTKFCPGHTNSGTTTIQSGNQNSSTQEENVQPLTLADNGQCGSCGAFYSDGTHTTMFCGHQRCPGGDGIHYQLNCGIHYACGDTYPDDLDHFTPDSSGNYACQ